MKLKLRNNFKDDSDIFNTNIWGSKVIFSSSIQHSHNSNLNPIWLEEGYFVAKAFVTQCIAPDPCSGECPNLITSGYSVSAAQWSSCSLWFTLIPMPVWPLALVSLVYVGFSIRCGNLKNMEEKFKTKLSGITEMKFTVLSMSWLCSYTENSIRTIFLCT